MTDDHVHVSDLRLDRLLAGDLTDDAKAAVLADAAACATCGERLATLRSESEAFVHRPRLPRSSKPNRLWLAAPVVLAAAAAVFLVVRARPEPTTSERVKGSGPRLIVAAGPEGRLAPVASGDRVRPGDFVQAGYSADRPGFGAVLARDGSGTASVYVPSHNDTMIALPAGDLRSFPESTVLDAVTGEEQLIVVWCEAAHPLGPLLAELEVRGDIAAPTGCTHRRVVLDKRAEPR